LKVLRITMEFCFDEEEISPLVEALKVLQLDEFYFAVDLIDVDYIDEDNRADEASDIVFFYLEALMKVVGDDRSITIKVLAIEVPFYFSHSHEKDYYVYKGLVKDMCARKDITLVEFDDYAHHDCLSVGEGKICSFHLLFVPLF
jgi:hypothetical protein